MEWSYSHYYKIETHNTPTTWRQCLRLPVYRMSTQIWKVFLSPTWLRSKCGSGFIMYAVKKEKWNPKLVLSKRGQVDLCFEPKLHFFKIQIYKYGKFFPPTGLVFWLLCLEKSAMCDYVAKVWSLSNINYPALSGKSAVSPFRNHLTLKW